MISLDMIRNFYPSALRGESFSRQLLREYVELLTLDYLVSTKHIRNLVFIGGTNLRLVKGIDRFSEDLDFDCKHFSANDFMLMTDSIITFLAKSGFRVEDRDRDNTRLASNFPFRPCLGGTTVTSSSGKVTLAPPKLSHSFFAAQPRGGLTAFRRSIHFPELLFDLGLSGHREARFMMKVECQDQGYNYQPQLANVGGCGFFFKIPVPPDAVLCSMKLAALLSRAKGRDFYDVMFLMAQTKPDFGFLEHRCGIANMVELKEALLALLERIDLNHKLRDVEHLLFNHHSSRKILYFPDFVASLPL